jgi:hypothetical protein
VRLVIIIFCLVFVSCSEETPEKVEPVKVLSKKDLDIAHDKAISLGAFLKSSEFTFKRILSQRTTNKAAAEKELRKWKRKAEFESFGDEDYLKYLSFCKEEELRTITADVSTQLNKVENINNISTELIEYIKKQNTLLQEVIINLNRKRLKFNPQSKDGNNEKL